MGEGRQAVIAARVVAAEQGQALRSAPRREQRVLPQPVLHPCMGRAGERFGTVAAKHRHQLLAQDRVDHVRSREFRRLHPERDQPEQHPVGGVGMHRGVDLVTGGDELQHFAGIVGRADFRDHAHIRVGAHEDHQHLRVVGLAFFRCFARGHRELDDPVADGGIFDRVLDRVDRDLSVPFLVEPFEVAHQRGGLAVAGGAADDHQPLLRPALRRQCVENVLFQPEPREVGIALCIRLGQQAQVEESPHIPVPGQLPPEGGDACRHARQPGLADGEAVRHAFDYRRSATAAVAIVVDPADCLLQLACLPLHTMGEFPCPHLEPQHPVGAPVDQLDVGGPERRRLTQHPLQPQLTAMGPVLHQRGGLAAMECLHLFQRHRAAVGFGGQVVAAAQQRQFGGDLRRMIGPDEAHCSVFENGAGLAEAVGADLAGPALAELRSLAAAHTQPGEECGNLPARTPRPFAHRFRHGHRRRAVRGGCGPVGLRGCVFIHGPPSSGSIPAKAFSIRRILTLHSSGVLPGTRENRIVPCPIARSSAGSSSV